MDDRNEISSNLERADTNLQVARELLAKEYYDVSASRSYDENIMNSYIFLTDEGHTFQPDVEGESIEIENLQVIGLTKGINADEAYKNLLLENPYLEETNFERIFCYQLNKDYEQNRKDYNLHRGVVE